MRAHDEAEPSPYGAALADLPHAVRSTVFRRAGAILGSDREHYGKLPVSGPPSAHADFGGADVHCHSETVRPHGGARWRRRERHGEPASAQAPAVRASAAKPVVIASGNGHRFKNGGPRTCVEEAFRLLVGGADPLDAVIAGVNIVERDPEDTSVGYGGLPNADGVVQLDACCMHGPKKRAGGVAALEGVRTPSLVAKAVMEQTDHHLLVGPGAQVFARNLGFEIEPDLNTPRSRQLWLEWKRRTDPLHYLDPQKRAAAGFEAGLQMVAEGLIDRDHFYGTINCNGLSPRRELAGVTTTSGLAWKIPGRVGDSPLLGAGLYVDGDVGAAGSTGRGEANVYGLCSFVIVENMRRGMSPQGRRHGCAQAHQGRDDRAAVAE